MRKGYIRKLTVAISFRPDPAFANGLNVPGIFTGKTSDELGAKWNETYPDDQVVLSEN